ncbi:POLR2I isoform 3 [Pongo abelii]|uniref:POLR2I isoform 3 n=1 Tax=Pongo abelii TaxID=9601 RepID=A0A2J8RS15_PONAB|nr:POLR2I isoform 3 [Pongo abelii]
MEPDGTYEPGFVGIRFCQECAGTVITSRRPTTAASMSTRSLTKWTN